MKTALDSTPLKSVAWAALCFHAFFAMADFGGQFKPEYGAAAAMLLLLAHGRAPWQELARQPVARWLALLIVFVIAHAGHAVRVFPSIGFSGQLTAAAELVRLGVFSCVIGWWLSRMPRAIPVLFGLMVAGLLAGVAIRMPWGSQPQLWGGQLRPRFGMPENLNGMLAALGSWLSLCLLLLAWDARGRLRWRRTLLVSCLVAYAGSFSVLLFSQSRGAWLAYVAMLPLLALAIGYAHRRGKYASPLPPVVLVVIVSVLLSLVAGSILAKRFAGMEQLLQEVAVVDDEGASATATASPHPAAGSRQPIGSHGQAGQDIEPRPATHAVVQPNKASGESKASEANNTAVSVRMSLYDFGIKRWQQHPWLGWGLRSTSALIAGSGLDLRGQRHAHLHSAYLDGLVGMGAVGTALLGLLLVLLLRELLLAWRSGVVSDVEFWMVAGSIGIVLVANGFDSLLWRDAHARAPLELVFGCCVAYGLIRRRPAASPRA